MSMGIIQLLTKELTGPVPAGISVVIFLTAGTARVFYKKLSVRAKKFLHVVMGIAVIALSMYMSYSDIMLRTHVSPLHAAIQAAISTFVDLVVIWQFLRHVHKKTRSGPRRPDRW